ncbi:hypothetical protein MAINES_00730 [Brevundimonas phage vB_BpoS-MaInes]|nr:hypothetical protein MAINES_00730 [Brevundimonas phage vB_BpoS-MaInes]
MIQLPFRNPLTELGTKLAFGLAALVLVLLLAWWLFWRPGQMEHKAKEAEANAAISQGRTESGAAATQVTTDLKDEEIKYDKITTDGNQGIRSAEGASAPVSTASSCATVRAICMQRSYKGSEQCRTLLTACPPESVGTR